MYIQFLQLQLCKKMYWKLVRWKYKNKSSHVEQYMCFITFYFWLFVYLLSRSSGWDYTFCKNGVWLPHAVHDFKRFVLMKLEKIMWIFCGPQGGLQWKIKATGWRAWEWKKERWLSENIDTSQKETNCWDIARTPGMLDTLKKMMQLYDKERCQ